MSPTDPFERALRFDVEVPASRDAVWKAWTTEAGIETFFAPDCTVEMEPGGAYEMYFDPAADPGLQGGEGNRILAVQPDTFLSFTWNAPPRFPDIRAQRTVVILHLTAIEPAVTGVTLTHVGWGTGEEWAAVYDYFDSAWGEVVLPRLQRRFESGPIDWSDV